MTDPVEIARGQEAEGGDRVLDLFSGIGGFSRGLESAGMEIVGHSEVAPECNRILKRHWPHVHNLGDIRASRIDQVRSLGRIDGICFGFPCQDISLAGPGTGLSGTRSALFWEALRAIRLARPAWALLENVAALLGRGMDAVLGALAEEGYDAEWDCIHAFDVGRPHARRRLYLAAYAQGNGRGPGRPGGLADGLTGLPIEPCWSGDPVAFFEERFAQPALLGMDDGPPRGLHRLGPCGNAVLPQIPELIGRSIMRAEAQISEARHAA